MAEGAVEHSHAFEEFRPPRHPREYSNRSLANKVARGVDLGGGCPPLLVHIPGAAATSATRETHSRPLIRPADHPAEERATMDSGDSITPSQGGLIVCDRLLPPTDWTASTPASTPAYWDVAPLSTCYGDREENSDAPFRNPETLAKCLADFPTDTVTCPEGTTACASIVLSLWAPTETTVCKGSRSGTKNQTCTAGKETRLIAPQTWIDSPLFTTVLPSPDPCVANATLEDGRCPTSLFLGSFFGAELDDERVTSSLFKEPVEGGACIGEGYDPLPNVECPRTQYYISAGGACCVNEDGQACNTVTWGTGPKRKCQTECLALYGFLAFIVLPLVLYVFYKMYKDCQRQKNNAVSTDEQPGGVVVVNAVLSASDDKAPSPALAPTPAAPLPPGSTGGAIATKKKGFLLSPAFF